MQTETINTSSRKGRYRHQLVSTDFFAQWSSRFEGLFQVLKTWHQQQKISSAEFVSLGLLAMLSTRRPDAFQKHKTNQVTTLSSHQAQSFLIEDLICAMKLFDLPTIALEKSFTNKHIPLELSLISVRFRSIPDSARQALIHWLQGQYPLELYFYIPTPLEVFQLQKKGLRCVSFISQKAELEQLHFDRDSLSFLIHDLIHAHEFYSNPIRARQQIGFYLWIDRLDQNKKIIELKQKSSEFNKKWDYLLSDMNSYCGHLLKTTHAILQIYGGPELTAMWSSLLVDSGLNQNSIELFQKINSPKWSTEDFWAVESVFENYFNSTTVPTC